MNEGEIHRMSHALQGSLQSALLNLQSLALTLDADAESRDLIEVVQDELLRGARLLVATFEVLSLEIGGVATVNLGTLVRRALSAHGIRRVAVANGAWPDVIGDERLLSLAIAHLARNAREATPMRRRVPEITPAAGARGGVDLVVRDWGRGFGAVKPPGRAFTSTRPNHVATGLLAIERIARLHGGSFSFTSSTRGTTVRLSLPATSPSPAWPEEKPAPGRTGRKR
jgi:signal transduction histidine kinase